MKKKFNILIEPKYSREYLVAAKNLREAKKIAWEKFSKKAPAKPQHEISDNTW